MLLQDGLGQQSYVFLVEAILPNFQFGLKLQDLRITEDSTEHLNIGKNVRREDVSGSRIWSDLLTSSCNLFVHPFR